LVDFGENIGQLLIVHFLQSHSREYSTTVRPSTSMWTDPRIHTPGRTERYIRKREHRRTITTRSCVIATAEPGGWAKAETGRGGARQNITTVATREMITNVSHSLFLFCPFDEKLYQIFFHQIYCLW